MLEFYKLSHFNTNFLETVNSSAYGNKMCHQLNTEILTNKEIVTAS